MRDCFVDNMASFGSISRMSAARFNDPNSFKASTIENTTEMTNIDDSEILCGTQLSPKQTFHSKTTTIKALPIIVDFRRLLLVDSKNVVDVVPGVSTLVALEIAVQKKNILCR